VQKSLKKSNHWKNYLCSKIGKHSFYW
jgi:hypothetical protein